MIQLHTFRAPLEGRDPEEVVRNLSERAQRLLKHRLEFLGAQYTHEGDIFLMTLRVQGLDQWRIRQHARKFGTFLFGTQGLKFVRPLQPHSVTTEPNRRGLTLDEGRTIRERPRNGQGRSAGSLQSRPTEAGHP